MWVTRVMGYRIQVTLVTLANLRGVVHAKIRQVLWVVRDGLLSANFLFLCCTKFNVSDLAVW
jgi:hypothetical protein